MTKYLHMKCWKSGRVISGEKINTKVAMQRHVDTHTLSPKRFYCLLRTRTHSNDSVARQLAIMKKWTEHRLFLLGAADNLPGQSNLLLSSVSH